MLDDSAPKLGPLGKIRQLLKHLVQAAALYRTPWDFVKMLFLRLTPRRLQRKLRSRGTIRLRFGQLPHPIHVRPGTSDYFVVKDILERGEYSAVAQWPLAEAPFIVDLGANIGIAAAYFLSLRPAAQLIAVEPDHANCQMIRRNCPGAAADGRLVIVEGFVAAHDGEAALDRSGDSWSFRKAPPSDGEKIPCHSVPNLLGPTPEAVIDILKCDIEGSEAELFAQCATWIKQVRYLIVETHHPYSFEQLMQDLEHNGARFRTLSVARFLGLSVATLVQQETALE